jgi:4-amino-4-deoxy-L-arabinose transferase-like glycosyltransferase
MHRNRQSRIHFSAQSPMSLAGNGRTLLRRPTSLLVLAGAFVVYLTYSIGLAMTRDPWVDEGTFVNPSYALITTGYPGVSVLEDSGSFNPSRTPVSMRGIREHMYFAMLIYIVALAGWMKVFGFGLLTSRLFTVFCGACLLLLWYYIVRYLTADVTVAVVTIALIAGDVGFIQRASEARMDMLSAVLGFGGLAVYLYLRTRSFSWAVFLSNLCVSASAFTHPNGGILAFSGLVFLTFYYDRRSIRLRHVAIALIPYLMGAAGWAWYIAKDVDSFRAQFLFNLTVGGRTDTFKSPLTTLKREIEIRYLAGLVGMGATNLSKLKLVIVIAYFCGVVGVAATRSLRQQKGYRALLFLAVIYFFVLAFTDGTKNLNYTGHVIPLFATLVAALLVYLWRNHSRAVRGLLVTVVIGLSMIHAARVAHQVWQDGYHKDYLPAISFLKQNVHGEQMLMGSGVLGFGLTYPPNLIDDFRLGALSGKTPDWIVVDDFYQACFDGLKSVRRIDFGGLKSFEPAVYQFVRNRLENEYRPVYQHGSYTIYRRNGLPATGKEARGSVRARTRQEWVGKRPGIFSRDTRQNVTAAPDGLSVTVSALRSDAGGTPVSGASGTES